MKSGQSWPIIRQAAAGDEAGVHSVIFAAFAGTAESHLVGELKARGETVIALVAEDASGVAGYVALSRMVSPARTLGMAPVCVRPDVQRSGIGSALVRRAIAAARAESWAMVFVLGDPSYYERFGFTPGCAAAFPCRYSGPHFMALAFEAVPAGPAVYASAFAELF